jgi:hypothetical protein
LTPEAPSPNRRSDATGIDGRKIHPAEIAALEIAGQKSGCAVESESLMPDYRHLD